MNERCDRTPPLTPPLRGGSFPLPSGGDRLKTSVFTRPLKRDSSRLSPSYGLTTGHEANEWSLEMMHKYEEFEVETDKAGELPMPFWSETVRRVMVE